MHASAGSGGGSRTASEFSAEGIECDMDAARADTDHPRARTRSAARQCCGASHGQGLSLSGVRTQVLPDSPETDGGLTAAALSHRSLVKRRFPGSGAGPGRTGSFRPSAGARRPGGIGRGAEDSGVGHQQHEITAGEVLAQLPAVLGAADLASSAVRSAFAISPVRRAAAGRRARWLRQRPRRRRPGGTAWWWRNWRWRSWRSCRTPQSGRR